MTRQHHTKNDAGLYRHNIERSASKRSKMKADLRGHPEAHSKITRKYKKQNGSGDEDLSSRQEPRTENSLREEQDRNR